MKSFASHCAVRMRLLLAALTGLVFVSLSTPGLAEPTELDRLFYTPAQRAQLNTARLRHTQPAAVQSQDGESAHPPAPVRYDGLITRSDGKTIRWVNGQAQVGPSSVSDLKPGQVRANGRIYEPYQVLRPQSVEPSAKEVTP